MTWYAAFQCLNCQHSWREPAPEDIWEMALMTAAPATCPLCGAGMKEGQVELLSHCETKIALLQSLPHPLHLTRRFKPLNSL